MEASIQQTIIERRSKARYPVRLTVRYHTVGRKNSVNGVGQTVNMSSGGLLVSAPHEIREGARMEINVEWPLLLDGNIPLQLVAVGRVVRSGDSVFAITFAQYQFRTMGRMLKSTADFPPGGMGHFSKRMAFA